MSDGYDFKPGFFPTAPLNMHHPSSYPRPPSTHPPGTYPPPPGPSYPPPPGSCCPPPPGPCYPPSGYPPHPSSYPSPPPSYPHPPSSYPSPPSSYPSPPTSYPLKPHGGVPVLPVYTPRPPTYPRPPHHGSHIVTGGHKAYYWIDWSAQRAMVPPTAVHGGVDSDGSQIYVGRAFHEGDWIPAKVIPERHTAYVAYGGSEHVKDAFQVLCEQRFDWAPTSGGNVPPGAVEGGRTSDGEPLYVGRVWHAGAHTVGKVHPSHGVCYIPYGGQELSFSDYEILVLRM